MSEKTVFLAPVYRGERFKDNSIPVELLGDLAEYQALVVELAKDLWRRENPGRQRLPQGFADNLDPSLRTIDEGSAIPLLERAIDPQQLELLPQFGELFERARDIIASTISAVAESQPIPSVFPRRLLARFNTFGSRLRDGESVELCPRRGQAGPTYTREVRRRLGIAHQRFYTETIVLQGWVSTLYVKADRFVLDTDSHGQVECPLQGLHDEIMASISLRKELEAMANIGTGHPVQNVGYVSIRGLGQFKAGHQLLRIERIDEFDFDADADRETIGEIRYILSLTPEDYKEMAEPAPDEDIEYLKSLGFPV